jgi:antitoxin component of MazEF toxin-antitoxin module
MLQRPKSSRLVTRLSVRLRREGGSLSVTIPRYIVRHWKLEAGMRLVVRSTDRGILLFPRYFLPYSGWPRHRRAAQQREEERDPHRGF